LKTANVFSIFDLQKVLKQLLCMLYSIGNTLVKKQKFVFFQAKLKEKLGQTVQELAKEFAGKFNMVRV